jgi:hypothetical protein
MFSAPCPLSGDEGVIMKRFLFVLACGSCGSVMPSKSPDARPAVDGGIPADGRAADARVAPTDARVADSPTTHTCVFDTDTFDDGCLFGL